MNAPVPNKYDPQNAAALVAFAADAYSDSPGSPHVIYDERTDTKAVFYESGTDVVVSFRGTQSLQNFVTDLRARRVAWNFPANGMEVHEGFKQALDIVWVPLMSALNRLNSSQRLWITGHSLGGALAKLAAKRMPLALAGVYTFGEPRGGNAPFRDAYDLMLKPKTFRVVDAEDFITRIPWLLGAFRHSGTEIFYPAQGPVRIVKDFYQIDPAWWQKGISDLFGTWSEWRCNGRLALLEDHHVSRYQALFSKS